MIDEEERKFILNKIKRITKEYDSYERFKIRVKNYYIKKIMQHFPSHICIHVRSANKERNYH